MNFLEKYSDCLKLSESQDNMTQYIIRTNALDKKIFIFQAAEANQTPQKIGVIYTDFLLNPDIRDISSEEIIEAQTNKIVGNIKLFDEEKAIRILNKKKKEISAITSEGAYSEAGKEIHYDKLINAQLLSRPEYSHLEKMGVTQAYFLNENSVLQDVFCFEKGRDISGVVNTRKENIDFCLAGLTLVLGERIINQDYIFEFMKK